MKPRNTLLLFLVLIALGAYLWFVERPSQEREAEAKKLVALKKDDVTGITLAYSDRTIVLEKSAEGHWRLTQPVAADADDPVVNNMLVAIAEADVSRTLDDVGDKLASYGLAPPEATVTLSLKEGSLPPIKVGKTTQIGSSAYLQKGDDPKVYIGTMAFQSAMKKQVKDLRDKRLVGFEDPDVRKVEITKGGATITAERDGDAWRITQPGAYPADPAEMRALLASIRGLRAEDFVSDDATADLGKYGLTSPQLRVAVWLGKDAAQKTLLLGAFKDDDPNKKAIYAKRAELATVVTLPDYALKNLDKPVNTLRDKTVLAGLGKDRVAAIAVTRKDGNGFTLAKRDGAWHVEDPGEGAERQPTMTRFLDDVAGFKGTDIMSEDPKTDLREYGLATPDMTVVLRDADGKTLGTLVGARGPEPAGDPNAKAFVASVGSGLVYVVKPYVYDRIDKKRADFRDAPKPSPGASPQAAVGAAALGAGAAPEGGAGIEGVDIPGDDEVGDDVGGARGDDGGGEE
ncbi:MAG: DUF4340 domain-containing protein [Deltaproteobacteria bacterium]|nr:DUF4340 domain-containing protein [Deltaproteobacteria bacterium]